MQRTFVMLAVFFTPPAISAAEPGDAKLVFPIIADYGGALPLPKAAEQPRKGAKVVFDISADANPNEVNKGLIRVARLLNLYGATGMTAGDVKIALVVHGEATKSALNDEAYKAKFGGIGNPNIPLVSSLRRAGVDVFVCGQALHAKGYTQKEIFGEVTTAAAAMTVVANRQIDGFALITVP